MSENGWNVHKFGGSILKDANSYSNVVSLINQFDGKNLIVVSAMNNLTNQLYGVCRLAKFSDFSQSDEWTALLIRVVDTIRSVLGCSPACSTEMWCFLMDFIQLQRILSEMASSSVEEQDLLEQLVVGYGEIWSARLLTKLLSNNNASKSPIFLDARDVLCVKCLGNNIDVCWDLTEKRLKKWFEQNGDCDLIIITGFIAFNIETECATTLKRDGSDLTATIFSALTKANCVNIWKDVDGIFNHNPHQNPDAKLIDNLTYEEAEESSCKGSFPIQIDCIKPAKLNGIPIFIKNFFKLGCSGTRIGKPLHP